MTKSQTKHDKEARRILSQLSRKGKIDFAALDERARQLKADKQNGLAAALYRGWLQRNPGHAMAANAWFWLGTLLSKEKDHAGARDAFIAARDIHLRVANPSPEQRLDLLKLHYGIGQELEALDKKLEALEEWRWVIKYGNAAYADERDAMIRTLNIMGKVLKDIKQPQSAIKSLSASLLLDPKQPKAIQAMLDVRQQSCQWPIDAPLNDIEFDWKTAPLSVFQVLNLSDDPEIQLNFARAMYSTWPEAALPPQCYNHEKIRIGYASSDLNDHPVCRLVVELFELHDKDRFEIYAFDWTKDSKSALRQRVIDACGDHFIRIDDLDDFEAAQLINENEIDVLFDLHGATGNCRPAIFGHRPAPIQIAYLGLPATSGQPGIDYVLCDRFLIPEEYAPHYSEKPLYMPDVFQASDRQRTNDPIPSRAECGLPEEGFVFCCLNNDHKYTPAMLDAWARILKRTPGSVLVLSVGTPLAEENLKREGAARDIEDRLVFSRRMPRIDQYLSRFAVCDLFLDTFPFNAGTTANDALWMGLPLLTLCGRSFAARMGGALLTAAGLDELITHSLADYEDLAVELAQNPERYQRLRARSGELRANSVLFDMPRFVRNLENILTEQVRQRQTT
ncbi:MAG: acetylglucosamine transferase [Azoarcus sp.]|jgi:predicted O-linked N-acetylglucosamine transferase (SPINDLY family)|nr:acetylglucosamine transferase [Azoarcus sp.]